MSNVEWLLREETGERVIRLGELIRVDNVKWRGTVERMMIGPGLRLFLPDTEAHQDFTVEPRGERPGQWIVRPRDDCRARRDRFSRRPAHPCDTRSRQCCLGPPPVAPPIAPRPAPSSIRWASVSISSASCACSKARCRELLRALLAPDVATCRVAPVRGNRSLRTVARSLFGTELNGPLRTLMMEVVIRLLALQAAAASGNVVGGSSRSCRRASAKQCTRPGAGCLPTCTSRRPWASWRSVRTSTRSSCSMGFRQLFGATVFEVLRNERLAHARNVLLAGRASPEGCWPSASASSHVSNLLAAFTARYGAPPRGTIPELK